MGGMHGWRALDLFSSTLCVCTSDTEYWRQDTEMVASRMNCSIEAWFASVAISDAGDLIDFSSEMRETETL